jgi:hypothetical protein
MVLLQQLLASDSAAGANDTSVYPIKMATFVTTSRDISHTGGKQRTVQS